MQEIEITIEDAKKAIYLGDLVTKLESNPDFKELIIDGYFKEDAARVVMLKADKEFQSLAQQDKLDKDIMGISVFGEYLRTKKILGLMAQESLREHEDTRQAIVQENI
jgi:hypothetical protein|tara:strand:+ start:343 stop:666 length:324 start_codon:yes stop_codon:yes gene_type:complete